MTEMTDMQQINNLNAAATLPLSRQASATLITVDNTVTLVSTFMARLCGDICIGLLFPLSYN